jgi:hypothetical protein
MGLTVTNTAATTAAVTNRFVTTTNMKVGAYTLANTTPVWSGACFITVTQTVVVTADTMGTIVVVGVDLAGQTRTETLTPVADSTVTGVVPFRTITSLTGVGWVIAGSNDTLVIGCAAGNIACGTNGQLGGVLVNNTVATAVTIADGARTILTIPASQAAGTYYNLNGVDFSSNLRVVTTAPTT